MSTTSKNLEIVATFKELISGSLGKLSTAFDHFKDRVEKVNQKFEFLNETATKVVSALISEEAVRRSIELAERQVEAEERLALALGENVDQLEHFKKKSKELQATTTFSDQQILELATQLLNAGAAVDTLDRKIGILIDTSAALNIEPLSIARGINQFDAETAGILGKRIPELRLLAEQLKSDGREAEFAEKALELLERRFKGTADALGKSPFAQFKIGVNLLNDQFERLGVLLIGPVDKGINVLVRAFTAVNDKLDKFKGLKGILESLADFGTKIVVAVAALLALKLAFTVLSTAVSTLWAILGLILNPIGLIALAVVALIVGILALTDNLDLLSKAWAAVSEFLDLILAGFIDWQLIIDSVILTLKDFWTTTKNVFERVTSTVAVFLVNTGAAFESGWNAVKVLTIKLGKAMSEVFFGVLIGVAHQIDDVTNAIANAVDKVGGNGDKLRTNLEATARGVSDVINAAQQGVLDEAEAKAAKIEADRVAAVKAIQEETQHQIDLNNKALDQAQEEVNKAAEKRAEQRLADGEHEHTLSRADQARLARIAREQAAETRLGNIRTGKVQELIDAEKELQLTILQGQFERGEISIKEFYDRRKKLESDAFDFAETQLTAQLKLVETNIAKELKARQEATGTEGHAIVDVSGLLIKQGDIEQQLTLIKLARGKAAADTSEAERRATEERIKALRNLADQVKIDLLNAQGNHIEALIIKQRDEMADLEKQLKDLNVSAVDKQRVIDDKLAVQALERRQATEEQGTFLLEKLTAAEKAYTTANQLRTNQVAIGAITQTQAQQQEAVDLARLIQTTQDARDSLLTLSDQPGFAKFITPQVDELNAKLVELKAKFQEVGGTFEQGFLSKIRAFTAEGDNLFTIGKKFGDIMTTAFDGIANAIGDAIVQGKSFGDAMRQVFLQLVQSAIAYIAKLLLIQAIEVTLIAVGVNTGGPIGANTGGRIQRFRHGGGALPRYGPNRDSVPALLTPGEFVIQRPAVDYYGTSLMSALNKMMISRDTLKGITGMFLGGGDGVHYNSGGGVQSRQASARSQSVSPAVLVASGRTTEALLTGDGGQTLLRFLSDHGINPR